MKTEIQNKMYNCPKERKLHKPLINLMNRMISVLTQNTREHNAQDLGDFFFVDSYISIITIYPNIWWNSMTFFSFVSALELCEKFSLLTNILFIEIVEIDKPSFHKKVFIW